MNDGAATTDSVTSEGWGGVSGGSNETMSGETVTSKTVTGVSGDWGYMTSQLLGKDGGNTGGGTIELSFSGLDGVNCLPGVVFSGVDGLALDFGSLVMEFAGSVDGGAGVVGGFDVGVDGGSLDVTRGDGGEGGSMSDGYGGGVGNGQGSGVTGSQAMTG